MSSRNKPLDPLDDPAVLQLIERTGVTDAPPVAGFLDNVVGGTLSGFPRGYLEAKATTQKVIGYGMDTAQAAARSLNVTLDQGEYEAGLGDAGTQRFQDAEAQMLEANKQTDAMVAATEHKAAEYRADPITTGAAGQIGNELAALLPRTIVAAPLGLGAQAVAAGAPAGMSESAHLQDQGVAKDTADQVGLVTAVTTGVGAVLPGGGFVKGALKDATVAALGNVGLGVANRAATAKLLADGGYKDMAAQYQAFDSTALATDLGFSLLLSGAHHLSAAQTDAILTNKNAENLTHGDGLIATDAASGEAIEAAKTDAIDALLNGRAVNVADHVLSAEMLRDPFHVPPELPPDVHEQAQAAVSEADLYDQVTDRIIGLESGGKADAKNPRSSATGAGQFIDSTWLALMREHGPAITAGKTDKQVLAMRADPELARQMVTLFARDNGKQLAAAGVEVNPANLYLAHHFGAGRVSKMLAKPDALMDTVLTAKELKANPSYKGKTVAKVLASFERRAKSLPAGRSLEIRAFETPKVVREEYAALPESEGGRILNTDIARELAPEYRADRSRSADVHEAASQLIKDIYAEKLARPTPKGFDPVVLFTAGGTGAGKTSGIQAIGDALGRPEITYDTNMSALDSAIEKVDQALEAGRRVNIVYVYRDPVESLRQGALPRAERTAQRLGSGRTVPIDEHVKTHAGSRQVAEKLQAHYFGDDRVQVLAVDNSRGKGNQEVVADVATLPKVAENGLREKLHDQADQAYLAGEISDRTLLGFAGRQRPRRIQQAPGAGDRGQPQAAHSQPAGSTEAEVSPHLTAAQQQAAETPDLPVLAGYDADGNPTYVSMSEALAAIEAEQASAVQDAEGFIVGANCFLRKGPG